MRRLAVLLAVTLLAVPAFAQQPTPAAKPAPKLVAPAALPAPSVFTGPSVPPLSPLPNSAADATAAQCSARCSRTYYSCLSGDSPEFCPGDWAQCRVICGNAARRTGR